LVIAGGKNQIKEVVASLLSARKDILVLIDYDDKNDEDLRKSISDAIEKQDHKVEAQQGNVLEVDDHITVTLIPIGLPNDAE